MAQTQKFTGKIARQAGTEPALPVFATPEFNIGMGWGSNITADVVSQDITVPTVDINGDPAEYAVEVECVVSNVVGCTVNSVKFLKSGVLSASPTALMPGDVFNVVINITTDDAGLYDPEDPAAETHAPLSFDVTLAQPAEVV